MNLNLNSVISGMFFLILIYLLLSNAGAFDRIIGAGGYFVGQNIALLQGRNVPGTVGARPTSLFA